MIDWIEDMLRSWGRQKYKRIVDEERGAPSYLGRLMTLGPSGFNDSHYVQTFREGMTGDAKKVHYALFRLLHAHTLTGDEYEAVFVRYVGRAMGYSEKELADLTGIPRQTLRDRVDSAHRKLCSCIDE